MEMTANPGKGKAGRLLQDSTGPQDKQSQFTTAAIDGIGLILSTASFIAFQLHFVGISEGYEPHKFAVISPDERARAPP